MLFLKHLTTEKFSAISMFLDVLHRLHTASVLLTNRFQLGSSDWLGEKCLHWGRGPTATRKRTRRREELIRSCVFVRTCAQHWLGMSYVVGAHAQVVSFSREGKGIGVA
jgi:hypothetical protein